MIAGKSRVFQILSFRARSLKAYINFFSFFILITQVEALAVKLTQNEGELIQEKFEVKKLVNFLKQVFFDI